MQSQGMMLHVASMLSDKGDGPGAWREMLEKDTMS